MNVGVVFGRGGRRARRPDDRGQSTVELALALPFVATLLLLVLQAALVARDQVLVVHAARGAVREASIGRPARDVVGVARRSLPDADVELDRGAEIGSSVTVEIRYRSRTEVPIVGALVPDPVLEARAVMRLEHEGDREP
jgi:hypothetical protein